MAITPQRLNAETLIDGAFDLIQVTTPGESITNADAQDALRRLNQMINGWSNLPLTFPFTDRDVFTVSANVGTYSIGPGGDFDTIRPTSIVGAGLLLNGSSPPVEIPRGLMTDDMYEALQVKTLTSNLWTDVYYNPTYSGGLGQIILWPIPTTGVNGCVLYRGDQIQGFANLTAEYDFPPGYADALEYNLAARLLTPYNVADPLVRSDIVQGAAKYLSMIKVANVKPSDLGMDPGLTQDRRYAYNILTGSGG